MKGCCTLFLVVFTLGSELEISPDSTVVIGLETRENEHARKLDFVQVNLNMAECMHHVSCLQHRATFSDDRQFI
jgi:hypothetical protein